MKRRRKKRTLREHPINFTKQTKQINWSEVKPNHFQSPHTGASVKNKKKRRKKIYKEAYIIASWDSGEKSNSHSTHARWVCVHCCKKVLTMIIIFDLTHSAQMKMCFFFSLFLPSIFLLLLFLLFLTHWGLLFMLAGSKECSAVTSCLRLRNRIHTDSLLWFLYSLLCVRYMGKTFNKAYISLLHIFFLWVSFDIFFFWNNQEKIISSSPLKMNGVWCSIQLLIC